MWLSLYTESGRLIIIIDWRRVIWKLYLAWWATGNDVTLGVNAKYEDGAMFVGGEGCELARWVRTPGERMVTMIGGRLCSWVWDVCWGKVLTPVLLCPSQRRLFPTEWLLKWFSSTLWCFLFCHTEGLTKDFTCELGSCRSLHHLASCLMEHFVKFLRWFFYIQVIYLHLYKITNL